MATRSEREPLKMQQNQCLRCEWTHCHYNGTDNDIISVSIFFSFLFSLRLSPRFQWFIFYFVSLFVRLSKKKNAIFKHLAQYCFSRAILHRPETDGGGRRAACGDNDQNASVKRIWNDEIYFIYFLSIPYAFLNTQMHFSPMAMKTVPAKKLNK